MRARRFVVFREATQQIVAECGGTQSMMENICRKLDRKPSGPYFFDDACEKGRYLPQAGPNISLR